MHSKDNFIMKYVFYFSYAVLHLTDEYSNMKRTVCLLLIHDAIWPQVIENDTMDPFSSSSDQSWPFDNAVQWMLEFSTNMVEGTLQFHLAQLTVKIVSNFLLTLKLKCKITVTPCIQALAFSFFDSEMLLMIDKKYLKIEEREKSL